MKRENNTKNKIKAYDNPDKESINTDPFGSWTGIDTENRYEEPVQDVDDL